MEAIKKIADQHKADRPNTRNFDFSSHIKKIDLDSNESIIQIIDENVISDEDCNLTDTEEEKTQTHFSTQKKAFLSIDKILNSIKKETQSSALMTKDGEMLEDHFGAMVKYKDLLPQMIAKKIDQVLLRNLAIKMRGIMHRKSIKKDKKWSKAFCYLDLGEIMSMRQEKVL
jgi:hypothetical protein